MQSLVLMVSSWRVFTQIWLIICIWLKCLMYNVILFLISQIYCHGPLLHTVQMAHLFKDSKTFVDMKLKNRPEKTMQDFNKFMLKHNNTPSELEIRDFVDVSGATDHVHVYISCQQDYYFKRSSSYSSIYLAHFACFF